MQTHNGVFVQKTFLLGVAKAVATVPPFHDPIIGMSIEIDTIDAGFGPVLAQASCGAEQIGISSGMAAANDQGDFTQTNNS